ncbi:hypothetical protein AgCh_017991 [Apium graveolens]
MLVSRSHFFLLNIGDPSIVASESLKEVFVNYGSNQFDLMKESMRWTQGLLRLHLHKVKPFSFHPAMNYRGNIDYSSLDPQHDSKLLIFKRQRS